MLPVSDLGGDAKNEFTRFKWFLDVIHRAKFKGVLPIFFKWRPVIKIMGVFLETCRCLSSWQISNPWMSGKSMSSVMTSNLVALANSIPFLPLCAVVTS